MSSVPVLSPLPDIGRYRLVMSWEFEVCGQILQVPLGTTYDGASIPRGAWYSTYSPFDPVVMLAALEHDYLCTVRPQGISSQDAADHFRARLVHATPMRRALMHRAVSAFGPQWD